MGIIGNLIKEQVKDQLSKGAALSVGIGIEDVKDKIEDEKRNALYQNNEFSHQLIINNFYKKPQKHYRYKIIDEYYKRGFYFIYNKRNSCFLCDKYSFKVGNIIMKRSLFGSKSYILFQGTRKIGVVENSNIQSGAYLEFNGWTIESDYDDFNIYDKNRNHLAEIKRDSFYTRNSRRHRPYFVYVVNYDNPIYVVMILMVLSMIHFS